MATVKDTHEWPLLVNGRDPSELLQCLILFFYLSFTLLGSYGLFESVQGAILTSKFGLILQSNGQGELLEVRHWTLPPGAQRDAWFTGDLLWYTGRYISWQCGVLGPVRTKVGPEVTFPERFPLSYSHPDMAVKCVERCDFSQALHAQVEMCFLDFFYPSVILSSSWKFSRIICKTSQRENLMCLGPRCHSDELFGEIGRGKWDFVKSGRQLQCPLTVSGIIGSSHGFHCVTVSECCSSERVA